MASQRKPVIVRNFSRSWSSGYAEATFPANAMQLEILDQAGKVQCASWDEVKWVCYVRDLHSTTADQVNPERLQHKKFSVRPRATGLWLRLILIDGEELEGLAANDRSLIDGVGLLLTPPDTRSNTQRVFVPRQAIQTLEVVARIGVNNRKRAGTSQDQPELFPTR